MIIKYPLTDLLLIVCGRSDLHYSYEIPLQFIADLIGRKLTVDEIHCFKNELSALGYDEQTVEEAHEDVLLFQQTYLEGK
jgi:hypothetical protein